MNAHEEVRAFVTDPVLQQRLAKYLVLQCFRNSMLEDLHAGLSPSSASGGYSDVSVSSPYGVIPWPKVSRLNDDEMKRLMIDDAVLVNATHLEGVPAAIESDYLFEGFRGTIEILYFCVTDLRAEPQTANDSWQRVGRDRIGAQRDIQIDTEASLGGPTGADVGVAQAADLQNTLIGLRVARLYARCQLIRA